MQRIQLASRWFQRFIRTDAGMATFLYYNSFTALGLCLASMGPVLLDLAAQTASSLRETGYTFGIRSFGYMLGSMCGPLYDRFPGHKILGVAMVGAAVGSAMFPLVRSIAALGVAVVLQGVAMGFCDVGGNTMVIWWWKDAVGPYMQFMHFTFALGATLAPMLLRLVEDKSHIDPAAASSGSGSEKVARPGSYDPAFYIIAAYCAVLGVALWVKPSPKPRVAGAHPADTAAAAAAASGAAADANSTAAASLGGAAATADNVVLVLSSPFATGSDGGAGASVGGAGALPASSASAAAAAPTAPTAPVLADVPSVADEVAALATGKSAPLPIANDPPAAKPADAVADGAAAATAPAAAAAADAHGSVAHAVIPASLNKDVWIVVAIVSALLFIYVGCETGFGAFVTSYAVVHLGRSEAEGQLLAGGYWGAIMVGRLASVPVSIRFKPHQYLGVSMAGTVVSSLLLLAFSSSIEVLWAGGLLYGFFMACIFPTAIALAEGYFPVQGRHTTAFVVGGAVGEMVLPFLISTFFESSGENAAEVIEGGGGQAAASTAPDGPGPVMMLWVVAIGCIVNQAVYTLLVRKGVALKAAITAAQPR